MARVVRISPIVRIRLLGTFHIERKGRAIHLPTRKVESLLAYLILNPKEHTRGHLATLFWGDFPDAKSHTSLRRALTILRKNIDREVIRADREIVQANPALRLWVDVLEFEKQARVVLADPAPEINCVDLDLYQGDLLSDLYDDWLAPLREYYHALYVDVLLRIVESLRAHSEYKAAIEYANKLLAYDPANERAHQHLMFCHITQGDRHKALLQYEACQRALQDELAVEPTRATQALYNWIKQATADFSSLAARLTNLPIPISSFIGRARELSAIKQAVAKARLVTLTGAGGSGKTRLAIHAATDLIDSFKDGVWWVELAPLTDPALVPSAVAKAVGVSTQSSQPVIEILAHFLREKQALLILDNCEHLLDACAQTTEQLLNTCPDLKIMCTSRETLGLAGENIWHVPVLSLPDVKSVSLVGFLMQYEGIHLFVERAQEVKPDFALTENNALAVVRICQQLDGIPLAIELAAARVQAMSATQMLAHMHDSFHLLTASNRTAQARHQTLRAVIDWSYELLTDEERQLFCRLSVFAGGWTLEAAEAVCAGEGSERGTLLNLLTRLVGKSLVIFKEDEQRYGMLETLRQYGVEKLKAAGQLERIIQQHLDYYLMMAEVGDKKIRGHEQIVWLKWFQEEQGNLTSAMERVLASRPKLEKGCELIVCTCWYWKTMGDCLSMKHWLELALSLSVELSNSSIRAKLLFNLSLICLTGQSSIKPLQAQLALEESLRIWKTLGPEFIVEWAQSALILGFIKLRFLDNDDGYIEMNKAASILQETGEVWWQAYALNFIGVTMLEYSQDAQRILSVLEKEMFLWEITGDETTSNVVLWDLAGLFYYLGEFQTALSYLEKSEQRCRKLGTKGYLFHTLVHLGDITRALKQFDRAEQYYQESLPLVEETLYHHWLPRIYQSLGYIMLSRDNKQQAMEYFRSAIQASSKQASAIQATQVQNANYSQAHYIVGCAVIAVVEERFDLAARLFGAFFAQPESNRSGFIIGEKMYLLIDQAEIKSYLERCKNSLDKIAFDKAWAEGSSQSLEDVVGELMKDKKAEDFMLGSH